MAAATEVYGEPKGLNPLDRAGAWLREREVRRFVARHPGLDLVDLGCGYHAALLCSLAGQLGHGCGVDFRVSAGARAHDRLDFVEASIEDALPLLADRSADAITMLSVLEHVWEPLDLLRGAHRVLRGGGVLFVHVPTWLGKIPLEWHAFRLGIGRASIDDHKAYYSRSQLWPLLVRAGFRPSAIRLRYHELGCALMAVARRDGD
jgi:SAM-dependent methyltransferase